MTKPRDLANSVNSGSIPGTRLENGAVTPVKLAGGPVFRAGSGTSFSVAHDTQTKATFGSAVFDTSSSFSSNRYTPNVAGYYQVNAGIQYEGPSLSTNYAVISLYKNGNVYTEGEAAVLIQYGSLSVSDVVYFNGTTDYIEIFMAHKQGAAQDMRGKYFSACWLRP